MHTSACTYHTYSKNNAHDCTVTLILVSGKLRRGQRASDTGIKKKKRKSISYTVTSVSKPISKYVNHKERDSAN